MSEKAEPLDIYPVLVWHPPNTDYRYFLWVDPGMPRTTPRLWIVGGHMLADKPRANWIASDWFLGAKPVLSNKGVVIGRMLLTGMNWDDFRVRRLEEWELPIQIEHHHQDLADAVAYAVRSKRRDIVRVITDMALVPSPQDHYDVARTEGIKALERALEEARRHNSQVLQVKVELEVHERPRPGY